MAKMMDFDVPKNFISSRKDINKIPELNTILESIENIVVTNAGDVVGNPKLGSPTRQLLFRRNTYVMLFSFTKKIEFAIQAFEPRIENINVTANYNTRDDALELKVTGKIKDVTIDYKKRL